MRSGAVFQGGVWRAATPLLVAQVGLLTTWDLAARPGRMLFWLLLGFAGLIWSDQRLKGLAEKPIAALLAVAAVLRVLVLPLPPTLSDDLLRYIWDGRVIAAGANPYLLPPDAPQLEPLRDELWQKLPHRRVETVYPPFALTVFSIASRLPAPHLALKAILAAADLFTCLLLFWIARRVRVPVGATVWYAWNPLPVLEIAGMGHVDALGVAAVGAVVLLVVGKPRQVATAGVAAAAAILAKLLPIFALPFWARASGRGLPFLGVALGLTILALAPVFLAAGGVPPGYLTYAVSWEFNGPIYEPLWRLYETVGLEEALAGALDACKQRDGRHEMWNRLYPFNYPRFLAKVTLGLGALAALVVLFRRRGGVVEDSGQIFAILILFSATVYPWYLLWLLPWAALCRQPAWLWLSGAILLSYWPQFGSGELFPWVFLAIWLPFFFLLVRSPRWRLATV